MMLFFFFFNDTATTEIYTLSLHDALPICVSRRGWTTPVPASFHRRRLGVDFADVASPPDLRADLQRTAQRRAAVRGAPGAAARGGHPVRRRRLARRHRRGARRARAPASTRHGDPS